MVSENSMCTYNGTVSNILSCTESSTTSISTILNSHINGQNKFEPGVDAFYRSIEDTL